LTGCYFEHGGTAVTNTEAEILTAAREVLASLSSQRTQDGFNAEDVTRAMYCGRASADAEAAHDAITSYLICEQVYLNDEQAAAVVGG